MESNSLTDMVQNGFRVAVGATAAVIEAIQDPYKRDELARDWAEKGAETEQEARNFVDTLMNQPRSPGSSAPPPPAPGYEPTTPADTATEAELERLTDQIAALRQELERLRSEEV